MIASGRRSTYVRLVSVAAWITGLALVAACNAAPDDAALSSEMAATQPGPSVVAPAPPTVSGVPGVPGVAATHGQVNVLELERWETTHPWALQEPGEEVHAPYGRPKRPTSAPMRMDDPQALELFAPVAPLGKTPPLTASFQAITDNSTYIPPDTDGAVGPNHIVDVINERVRISSKSGTVISTVTNAGFWASSGYTDVFDPHIFYDPYGGRWIFAGTANPASPTSAIMLATSHTSDPTGTWDLYSVKADAQGNYWADFPTLGFTKDWITVGVNRFPVGNGNFDGDDLFVWDKASVYAGTGKHTHIHMPLDSQQTGWDFSATAAVTFDPKLNKQYLIEDWDGTQAQLYVWTISGSVGSEQLTGPVIVTGPAIWDDGADQNTAPQQGSSTKINTGDSRIYNVTYRNGSLWLAHGIFLPAGKPTRSSVQWWELDPSGGIKQWGRIDDPTGVQHFAYPSLAVNAHNDVMLGYSRFSANQFASANYAYRTDADPLNAMRADTVMKAGEGVYSKLYGGSRNRWGDYSNTVVDPIDDVTMWTIQEYAGVPSGIGQNPGIWSTWWGSAGWVCDLETNGLACDDGDSCTLNDACFAGACVGRAQKQCPAPPNTQCTIGLCQSPSGTCSSGPAPDLTGCDDGNLCTVGDYCMAGKCNSGSPVTCSDFDACRSGACDSSSGKCAPVNKADGTACDDLDACTTTDSCQAGKCVGSAHKTCDDVECKVQAGCQQGTGACMHTNAPNGTPCTNGTCSDGACVNGQAPPSGSPGATQPPTSATVEGGACGCTTAPASSDLGALGACIAALASIGVRRRRASR
jgi:hypothetical protein